MKSRDNAIELGEVRGSRNTVDWGGAIKKVGWRVRGLHPDGMEVSHSIRTR